MENIDKKNGNRNIWLVSGSSFFNDIGAEIITPILPFYIASLGGGGIALGLVSGLREGLASLLKIWGGWLSDRLGRKTRIIFSGYFISSLFRLILGFTTSWPQVISAVSLERIGKLRDAPRDALIAESTKNKGRGFAINQMLDSAGGVAGTLLAIFLFWYLQFAFNLGIFIAAAISSLALVPLLFVREKRDRPQKRSLIEGIENLSPKLRYTIFVTSVFALANFGLAIFFIARVQEITGSLIYSLLLYALFGLCYAVFTIPFGNLSDRVGRKKLLIPGYILFFLTVLLFPYSSALISLIVMFALYGIVMALTESNQRALIADLSGKMKGTALGAYHGIKGLVAIPAGIIAGVIWSVSPEYMFYYLALVSLIAIFLLFRVKEK